MRDGFVFLILLDQGEWAGASNCHFPGSHFPVFSRFRGRGREFSIFRFSCLRFSVLGAVGGTSSCHSRPCYPVVPCFSFSLAWFRSVGGTQSCHPYPCYPVFPFLCFPIFPLRFAHTHIHVHTYTNTRIHVHTYTHTQIHTHTHMHTHQQTRIHTYLHTYRSKIFAECKPFGSSFIF